jgi:hypothetical protein
MSFLRWFVGSSCADIRDLILPACSGQPSTNYSFPHRTLFQLMCPHRPSTGAGSRAGPPVSECVFLIAHTKDVRAKLIKAAHRTGLLCTAHVKAVLYVDSLFCAFRHGKFDSVTNIHSYSPTPKYPTPNSGYTHRAKK